MLTNLSGTQFFRDEVSKTIYFDKNFQFNEIIKRLWEFKQWINSILKGFWILQSLMLRIKVWYSVFWVDIIINSQVYEYSRMVNSSGIQDIRFIVCVACQMDIAASRCLFFHQDSIPIPYTSKLVTR